MARFAVFALAGAALGYVMAWLGAARRTRTATLVSMAARLVLFVLVVGLVSRRFGPAAGLTTLVAAIVTRALAMRSKTAPPGGSLRSGGER